MHVELSNGQSAELRDIDSLRFKDRDEFLASMNMPANLGPDGLPPVEDRAAFGVECKNAVTRWAIVSWTFDAPIPSVDPDSLQELSIRDGVALEAAAEPLRDVLMPDFSPSPSETSPTPPSNA